MSSAVTGHLLKAFRDVVGGPDVVTDQDILVSHVRDWTGRFLGSTTAMLRPRTPAQVAEVMALCRSHGVAIVPQGGNTGLVGGSVPLDGEIIVSTERFDQISDVNERDGQLTAGAGVTIAALRDAALEAGWAYGVDLASRDSATVGGSIATNAGGLNVLRYGATRRQLLGVEAMLGNGSSLRRLRGLVKDNTGFDLSGLLCGSEGTLGIITSARLSLIHSHSEHGTALIGYRTIEDAVNAGSSLRAALPSLEAVELFMSRGLDLVCRSFELPLPFGERYAAYLVVEAADDRDPTTDLATALSAVGPVIASAVADGPRQRQAIWRYREAHTEAINLLGEPHKLDVTLPSDELATFIETVTDLVSSTDPDAQTWCFGHVADGNIHVNITGPGRDDLRVDDAVLRLVISMGGSISAEHGIGTAKKPWLEAYLGVDELRAFRTLKQALDPDGICNPNVLV